MTLKELIPLAIKTSVILIVLALGLRTTMRDATYLFRNPRLLFRTLFAMDVVMPFVAWLLVSTFDLYPAVKIALVALSVSPVPPILPKKQVKEGAGTDQAFGLLVAAVVIAIISVPLTMRIFGAIFALPTHMPSSAIAALVFQTVLIPLAIGIVIHRLAPAFAERLSRPLGLIATVLLLVGVLPILVVAMPAVVSLIGNGTVGAILAFSVSGLIAGHLLGGPSPEYRTTLALSTASRHPGIAIAIATTNFPEQKLATAAILLYLIVNTIATIPYLKWVHSHAPHVDLPGPVPHAS